MAFSRQHNHISPASVLDGVFNRFLTVADFYIFPARLPDSYFNVVDNILWILESWIIRCDNCKIGKPS